MLLNFYIQICLQRPTNNDFSTGKYINIMTNKLHWVLEKKIVYYLLFYLQYDGPVKAQMPGNATVEIEDEFQWRCSGKI
jgi:hypothetical protein